MPKCPRQRRFIDAMPIQSPSTGTGTDIVQAGGQRPSRQGQQQDKTRKVTILGKYEYVINHMRKYLKYTASTPLLYRYPCPRNLIPPGVTWHLPPRASWRPQAWRSKKHFLYPRRREAPTFPLPPPPIITAGSRPPPQSMVLPGMAPNVWWMRLRAPVSPAQTTPP